MKYAVVIPTRNTAPHLVAECLESVRLAADPEYSSAVEVVLVDDGSSQEHALHYRRLIGQLDIEGVCARYIRSKGLGIAHARNVGVLHSTGDWVCLVDSDDLITANFFQSLEEFLSPQAWFGFTDHIKVSLDRRQVIEIRRKSQYYQELLLGMGTQADPFLHGTFLIHCHVLRRELFAVAGLFNSSIRYGDEIDFHLRCSRILSSESVFHVPKVLYVYRANPDGVCGDPMKYAELIQTIEGLLLSEAQRRGMRVSNCWRAGKRADGSVAYEMH